MCQKLWKLDDSRQSYCKNYLAYFFWPTLYICDDEQARMPEGSKFHTEGAATLKPRKAKVAWTRGTDNRLVLDEYREYHWYMQLITLVILVRNVSVFSISLLCTGLLSTDVDIRIRMNVSRASNVIILDIRRKKACLRGTMLSHPVVVLFWFCF